MKKKLLKYGSSRSVVIPKAFLDVLDFGESVEVEMNLKKKQIIITKVEDKKGE